MPIKDPIDYPFKTALQEGPAQIGLWMALADPYAAELVAQAGFDWLVVDGEHAPNDLRSMLAQLQVLAAYPVMPVIRPPKGETALLKQILDIGAQTLLIPMVESAEQARELVAAVRYPPRGVRGVGSAIARASRWNRTPDYLGRADQGVCLLAQIESKSALESLEDIASVDGIDGLFIGPADLAASLGHLGDPGHPDVAAAIDLAIARIARTGKASGILAFDATAARRYLQLGCRFVAVGADVTLLGRAAEALAASFLTTRGSLPDPRPGALP